MLNTRISSVEPMLWKHHAKVDRTSAKWQTQSKATLKDKDRYILNILWHHVQFRSMDIDMKNCNTHCAFIFIFFIVSFYSMVSCSDDSLNAKTVQQWAKIKANFIDHDFKSYGIKKPGKNAIAGLEFTYTSITDNDLKILAQFKPELYHIGISGLLVTDNGIHYLSTIPSLRSIELGSLNNTGCDSLAKLVNLRWLSFSGTKISDKCLISFTTATNLVSLNINNTLITGSGFNNFNSQLQTLYAEKTNINDVGLKFISQFNKLQLLHISNTKISNNGLAYLSRLANLTDLDISNTKITDAGIINLVTLSQQLTDLHLDNLALTDSVITTLSSMTVLKKLYLFSTKLTPAAITRLRKILPKTDILH